MTVSVAEPVDGHSVSWCSAAGLAVGHVADRLIGDPARGHPVAWFGAVAKALERRMYADSRARGVCYCGILVGSTAGAGLLIEHAARGKPMVQTLATAAVTWTVLGGTSLDRAAAAVERMLQEGDLEAARVRLTHLVGRDTAQLDAEEIARAVVESLAENISDAVVAPLVLGAVGGIPALAGYRAANTLDAMVGHRNARYQRFGWASARLDDLLNLPGSRVAALIAALNAPSVGGSSRRALEVWRRDAGAHPSPNAGPVEASFAGALGVRLGGENTYGGRIEHRAWLGHGRSPEARDIGRARGLARRVDLVALAVSVILALAVGRRPRRPRRPGR